MNRRPACSLLPARRVLRAGLCLWWASCACATELRLGIDPMQSGVSVLLTVHSGGAVEFYEYERYQLVMRDVRADKIAAVGESRVFGPALEQAMREAVQRSYWGEEGHSEGDQFWIQVSDTPIPWSASGDRDVAPPALRKLIQDLIALGRGLPTAPRAPGYLRSSAVSDTRRQYLTERGQQFQDVASLPPSIRNALESAVRRPGDFAPVTAAQWQALSEAAVSSWEYTTARGALFQSQRYSTPAGSPPARKNK